MIVPSHKETFSHLMDQLKAGRVAHARLISGSGNVGQLAFAVEYARALLCEKPGKKGACGKCESCELTAAFNHPDMHFSFPVVRSVAKTSSEMMPQWTSFVKENPFFTLKNWVDHHDEKGRTPGITVSESEDILKKLSLKSFAGGYKVLIMWHAEMMNTQTANKLLKIIEEPPEKTVFLLCTEDREQIIGTILSRTQLVHLSRPSTEDVQDLLLKEFKQKRKLAEEQARLADGDVGLIHDFLQESDINLELHNLFVDWMRLCAQVKPYDMLISAEGMAAWDKNRQFEMLHYGEKIFRECVMHNYTSNYQPPLADAQLGFLNKFSRFVTSNNVMDIVTQFEKSIYYLERNANAKLVWVNLTMEMMRLFKRR